MPFQALYSNIFSNKHHYADDGSMLAELTERYPYFSLAHFFLLKNTAGTDPTFSKVAAKTALHFNNAFLLHEQLHQAPVQDNLPDPVLAAEHRPETREATDIVPPADTELPDEVVEQVSDTTPQAGIILQEEIGQDIAPGEPGGGADLQASLELPSNNAPVTEEVSLDAETVIPLEILGQDVPVLQEVVVAVDAPSEMENPLQAVAETPFTLLASGSPEIEVPLFEPLSASDYFASQGIKIIDEQQPTDRMGKQLKSFTAWLKTMKKVHDNKLPGLEGAVDLTVQTLAEKSNKGEEILTEAMAEVFLQQGKSNKAKEIYEKLSLLNPAKSAYFAAKLEQIK